MAPGLTVICAAVHVGMGDEPPTHAGLAHLVEHILLDRRRPGMVDLRARSAGLLRAAGRTRRRHMTFTFVLPDDAVTEAVPAVRRLVQRPEWISSDLVRQHIAVVAAEIAESRAVRPFGSFPWAQVGSLLGERLETRVHDGFVVPDDIEPATIEQWWSPHATDPVILVGRRPGALAGGCVTATISAGDLGLCHPASNEVVASSVRASDRSGTEHAALALGWLLGGGPPRRRLAARWVAAEIVRRAGTDDGDLQLQLDFDMFGAPELAPSSCYAVLHARARRRILVEELLDVVGDVETMVVRHLDAARGSVQRDRAGRHEIPAVLLRARAESTILADDPDLIQGALERVTLTTAEDVIAQFPSDPVVVEEEST